TQLPKPPFAHLMRDHLGRGRVDAGGDRDTLWGDVVPEPLDLPIRVCELGRHRPVPSCHPRQPGLLGRLLLGGPLFRCLHLRRLPRSLSSHSSSSLFRPTPPPPP